MKRVNGGIIIALSLLGSMACQQAMAGITDISLLVSTGNVSDQYGNGYMSNTTWGTLSNSGSGYDGFAGYHFSYTESAVAIPGINPYDPTIQANVSGFDGSASVSLTYYFEVTGPTNGLSIPLDIAVSSSISSNPATFGGGATANSSFAITPTTGGVKVPPSLVSQQILETGYSPTSYSMDPTVTATSGTVYEVDESVNASDTGTVAGVSYTASALIDPMITIDPSFKNSQYSLEFSPSLAPEPASIAPLALGALGLLVRRRNRVISGTTRLALRSTA